MPSMLAVARVFPSGRTPPTAPSCRVGGWSVTASWPPPQSRAGGRPLSCHIAARAEGRARTRDQIGLASLIMTTGDPIKAAALGTQALDWAGPLRSRRAADDLRDLRCRAEPHTRLPEVAELCQRIGTVIAA